MENLTDGYTPVYDGADLAEAGIDVAGNFLVALAGEASTIAVIIVAIIVISVVIALIKNVFGITDKIKGFMR